MKKEKAKNKVKKKKILSLSKIIKLFCVFVAIILLAAAFFLYLVIQINSSPPLPEYSFTAEALRVEDNGNLIIEVRNGETAFSVGRRLEEAGIIRDSRLWYALFRLDSGQLKTGTYMIELPATQTEIRSVLVGGEQLLFRVTIPEGYSLRQMAAILESEGICTAEDFLASSSSQYILNAYNIPGASMEGYLFPDTYLFPLSYPSDRVVQAMADNFFRRLRTIDPSYESLTPTELNNLVILASIVEREYRAEDEAALMAGVFFNRLRIGMMLQSCATVVYVITEVLGLPHPERLFYRDLDIVNPYNTYMNAGLPPGPISAPGLTALRGVFEPASSNYLFFRLLDPASGRHYFSRTLDEHIQAGDLLVKGW